MLLSKLFSWIKNHNTFHVFILEILAVFIGLTASLVVDNWRQQQADYKMLDRQLQEVYYGALKNISNTTSSTIANNQELQSLLFLIYGDTSQITDEELSIHFWKATSFPQRLSDASKTEISNATLSIPFNETISQVMSYIKVNNNTLVAYNRIVDAIAEKSLQILKSTDLVHGIRPFNTSAVNPKISSLANSLYSALFDGSGQFIAYNENITNIHKALANPDFRVQLKQLIGPRTAISEISLSYIIANQYIVDAILNYSPDMAVPFVEVGIDGSATKFGWETYIPMKQEVNNSKIWKITIDLKVGEIKFRADKSWSVNWGSSTSDSAYDYSFVGETNSAFPTGTARLEGSNIPVIKAGRYNITFNTATLLYSFEKID